MINVEAEAIILQLMAFRILLMGVSFVLCDVLLFSLFIVVIVWHKKIYFLLKCCEKIE